MIEKELKAVIKDLQRCIKQNEKDAQIEYWLNDSLKAKAVSG
jgi:hypothetical protein